MNIITSKDKKKILLALPLPPPYSGQEKIASIILNSKITREFDCSHVDTSNKQVSNEYRGSLKWINISSTIKITWKIFWVVFKKRPVLINVPLSCNTLGFLKYFCLILPCLIFRTKVVSRLGASHFDKFYTKQYSLYRFAIRWVLNHIDCIIVRGKQQKNQFEGIYNRRIECVYVPSTGINSSAWKRDYEFERKIYINVLYLGIVSQAKGSYDLLKAIPQILALDDRFRFHFVGDIVRDEKNIVFIDKEDLDIKKFVKEKNLESFVTFYGRLEGEEKERKLKEADLFVFPSYSEGSPFSVVEAMEYGLPVIATRVGNLPEIFEDEKNVLYVDFNSSSEIKEAILRIKNNPDLSRMMVLNSFEILQGILSLEEYERAMIKLFHSVIES